jgi:hypothetical protein
MLNQKTLPLKVMQSRLTETHLESILATLDRLHNASADDALETVSAVSAEQLIGWLEDIIYTAQETIQELNQAGAEQPEDTYADLFNVVPMSLYCGR